MEGSDGPAIVIEENEPHQQPEENGGDVVGENGDSEVPVEALEAVEAIKNEMEKIVLETPKIDL